MQVDASCINFWTLFLGFIGVHMTSQSSHDTFPTVTSLQLEQLEQLEAGTPTVFAMTSADVILTWTQHDVTT